MKKLPPIEKIYEAYSAIVDTRVELREAEALISSSNGAKKYIVTWKDNIYTSTDSATYWQGYAGYPILAVLMLQGNISFNPKIAQYFSNINWTQLNAKYKADYTKAVEEILSHLKESGVSIDEILEEVQSVYEELHLLEIEIKRGKHRSPKSNIEKTR